MAKRVTVNRDILLGALVSLLLGGCAGGDSPESETGHSGAIRFASEISGSRSELVQSIPEGGVMSVSCIRKNVQDKSYNYYFQNCNYTLSASDPGFVNGNIYWWWREADTEYNFYAFYPAQEENLEFTPEGPKLTYVVSQDGTSPDILAAEAPGYDSDHNSVVALSFHHLLSGVNFKVTKTTPKGKITGLQIQNLCFTGSYCAGTWGNYTNLNHTTVKEFDVPGDGKELVIPSTGYEYMVLPQQCGENAALTLTFTDYYPNAGYVHSFTLPLKDFTFEAGKGYTFVIDGTLTQITVNCVDDATGAIMDSWKTTTIYSEKLSASGNSGSRTATEQ